MSEIISFEWYHVTLQISPFLTIITVNFCSSLHNSDNNVFRIQIIISNFVFPQGRIQGLIAPEEQNIQES